MSAKGRVVTVVLLAGVAAAGYYAWHYANQTRQLAEETADNIEAQLRELDPVTRAAVIARLGSRARNALPGRA